MVKRYRKKRNYFKNKTFKKRNKRFFRKQKGGFGGALALGMMAPMLLGTLGKMMKVNVNA